MYVCMCRAITDRQIRDTVRRGASNLDEVQQLLPVANCCGACEETARELIHIEVQTSRCEAAA
jgi:bacterioferritin-associated ferredoxin